MAYTYTTVKQTPTLFIVDVTCVDGDTIGAVAHNLVGTPLMVTVTPLVSPSLVQQPNFSAYADATNINVVKLTTVGGGGAKVVRITAKLPHSML